MDNAYTQLAKIGQATFTFVLFVQATIELVGMPMAMHSFPA
jgi:hypothetical protein